MTTVAPPHHPPPAPPPSGTNGHVVNLLGQAKMSGLLPSNTTGGGYPSSSISLAALGRIPKYQRARDPQVQQKNGGQNRNDTKRRKLNNKKASPKKAAQPPKPQLAKNGKATKQRLKPSARESIDPKIIDNLIAEALAMQNGPNVPASDSIPKFPSIPKPTDYPPPLPPIHNKAIEQQCFTHRSYVHDPLAKDAASSLMHYERLEFLGDSFMNYCVTKFLYNTLPNLREGELTRFRSQIISNDNIRHYAKMYGFPDRIRLSSGAERDDIRDTGKKVADIFEAYIGGILTDQPDTGEQTIMEWMAKVTAPQIAETEKIAEMILNVNKNAKQELYVLLDAEKAPAPTYVVTREGNTNMDFEVTCLVQGKEMGRGIGKNKNEAGTRAAMQALERLRACTLQKEAEEQAATEKPAKEETMSNSSGSEEESSDDEDGNGEKNDKSESSGVSASDEESESEGEIDLSSDAE
jgi:dsRNA-specific ribonuclease